MSVTQHALMAAEAVLSKLSPTATQEDTIAALRDICDDDFFVYSFKVVPCGKSYSHKWTQCPCAHQGETARRRDPRTVPYRAVLCPLVKAKKTCPLGDSCGYAHNVFEHWLHPARYKTRLCSFGLSCNRPICFFAHTAEELRCVPNSEDTVDGREGDDQLIMMQLMQLAGQDAGGNSAFGRQSSLSHQQQLPPASMLGDMQQQQQQRRQQQQQQLSHQQLLAMGSGELTAAGHMLASEGRQGSGALSSRQGSASPMGFYPPPSQQQLSQQGFEQLEMSYLLSSLQQQQAAAAMGMAGRFPDQTSLLNALLEASFGFPPNAGGPNMAGMPPPPGVGGTPRSVNMSRAMSANVPPPAGAHGGPASAMELSDQLAGNGRSSGHHGSSGTGQVGGGGGGGIGRAMSASLPPHLEMGGGGGPQGHDGGASHMQRSGTGGTCGIGNGGGPFGNFGNHPFGGGVQQGAASLRSPRHLHQPKSPQVRGGVPLSVPLGAQGRQVSESGGSNSSMSRADSGAVLLPWGGTCSTVPEGRDASGGSTPVGRTPSGGGGANGGSGGAVSAFACQAAQGGGGVPPVAQGGYEGLLPALNSALAANRQHQASRAAQQQQQQVTQQQQQQLVTQQQADAAARRCSGGGTGHTLQPPSPAVSDATPGLCTPPAAVPPLASPFSSSTCSLPSSIDFSLSGQTLRMAGLDGLGREGSGNATAVMRGNRCSSGGMTDGSADPGGCGGSRSSRDGGGTTGSSPGTPGGTAAASAAVAQVLASLQNQGYSKDQLVMCLSQVLAALLASP